MKKRNFIYACLIIALGIFAFVYAGRYAATTQLGSGSTGGDFFPRLMSIGLIVTGSIIIYSCLFSKKPEDPEAPIKWIDLAINVAALAAFQLLLKPLGFILDGVWISAFIMYRFGCRNYLAIAIWSVLMPTAIFCVFYYMLYVGLPLGVLAPILPKY